MGTDRARRFRVVVADDHPAMRRSMCEVLASAGFEVCGQARSGPEVMSLVAQLRPDLCVLDIVMPEWDGVTGVRALRDALPDTRVVMITALPRAQDALAAKRAGASGYLVKDGDPRELPRVLRSVAEGADAFQSPWLERARRNPDGV